METTVKRTGRNSISKGIIQICSIYVEWNLNAKGLKLSAMDMEHITNAIIDNSVAGELCTIAPNGTIVSGGWNIQW